MRDETGSVGLRLAAHGSAHMLEVTSGLTSGHSRYSAGLAACTTQAIVATTPLHP